jgi:hypothetical protein
MLSYKEMDNLAAVINDSVSKEEFDGKARKLEAFIGAVRCRVFNKICQERTRVRSRRSGDGNFLNTLVSP